MSGRRHDSGCSWGWWIAVIIIAALIYSWWKPEKPTPSSSVLNPSSSWNSLQTNEAASEAARASTATALLAATAVGGDESWGPPTAGGVIVAELGTDWGGENLCQPRHQGIDIEVRQAVVLAARSGVIFQMRYDPSYGNGIFIRHSGGLISYYWHLQSWDADLYRTWLEDQAVEVRRGQQIGISGSSTTGEKYHTTSAAAATPKPFFHLHFGIYDLAASYFDPLDFLPAGWYPQAACYVAGCQPCGDPACCGITATFTSTITLEGTRPPTSTPVLSRTPTPSASSTPTPSGTPTPTACRTPSRKPPTLPPPPIPTTLTPGVCSCSGNIYNCSDFANHAAAVACFQYCISLGRGDIHKLDENNNGNPCESLPPP